MISYYVGGFGEHRPGPLRGMLTAIGRRATPGGALVGSATLVIALVSKLGVFVAQVAVME